MKRRLLLASGCFLLLSGWFSAFILNSVPQEGYLYILGPTLLLGVGLGLMRKTVGGKLAALTLAFTALLALLIMNQFFPGRSVSISAFQQRMKTATQADFATKNEANHFSVTDIPLFATLTDQVGMMTSDASGNIYASLPNLGAIYQFTDTDRDGIADEQNLFHVGLDYPHGLLWEEGKLYVVEPSRILELVDTDQDHQADQVRIVLDGLPDQGDNRLRSITKGDTSFLYLSDGREIYRIDLK